MGGLGEGEGRIQDFQLETVVVYVGKQTAKKGLASEKMRPDLQSSIWA